MIPRYTNPEMGRIWSEQRRYETWLQVEVAAAEAMAAAGIVPAEAARDLREKGAFNVARIDEIEKTTQHDVIAFTTSVAEIVGPSARWLHFGLTSSDVVDTAQAIQMVEACDLILTNMPALASAIQARADEHKHTPMIGRTHGVHAEPMTFGLKLALWYAEWQRDIERVRRAREAVRVGKISGAVGTFAHLDPSIEASVCDRLGLAAAPISSQVIKRARRAGGRTTRAWRMPGNRMSCKNPPPRNLRPRSLRGKDKPMTRRSKAPLGRTTPCANWCKSTWLANSA